VVRVYLNARPGAGPWHPRSMRLCSTRSTGSSRCQRSWRYAVGTRMPTCPGSSSPRAFPASASTWCCRDSTTTGWRRSGPTSARSSGAPDTWSSRDPGCSHTAGSSSPTCHASCAISRPGSTSTPRSWTSQCIEGLRAVAAEAQDQLEEDRRVCLVHGDLLPGLRSSACHPTPPRSNRALAALPIPRGPQRCHRTRWTTLADGKPWRPRHWSTRHARGDHGPRVGVLAVRGPRRPAPLRASPNLHRGRAGRLLRLHALNPG